VPEFKKAWNGRQFIPRNIRGKSIRFFEIFHRHSLQAPDHSASKKPAEQFWILCGPPRPWPRGTTLGLIRSFDPRILGFVPNTIQIRRFASAADFKSAELDLAIEWKARALYEEAMAAQRTEFTLPGFCIACQRMTDFAVDLQFGDGVHPNWRERLVCSCGLNNRLRASLHFLEVELGADPEATLYATEQVTPLANLLKGRYPKAIFSEFLQDGTSAGETNAQGLRHENLCALSFPDDSMDFVLSFDVLEHIPDYQAAFREMARVLRPGGKLLASFPFDAASETHHRRAVLEADGTIRHLLPPEYHGDPLSSQGCLCFQVFGWEIMADLRAAGFSQASALYYWSADFAYLGGAQFMLVATR
jgi:SAM-dependent methyltransferase